jgi:hypothetical protein
LRDTTGTQDANLAWAWMTSPTTAGTGCSPHTLQDRRAASLSRPPDRQLILIRCGPRVFDTLKLPRPLVTPRLHHNQGSKREAPVPLDDRFSS